MTTTYPDVNDVVIMTDDALDNYGEQWRGVRLRITHRADQYMSAERFFASGKPTGFHPGYDESAGCPLYDLRNDETGKALNFSLYAWEIQ